MSQTLKSTWAQQLWPLAGHCWSHNLFHPNPQQEEPSEASSAPIQALLPLCHGCRQSCSPARGRESTENRSTAPAHHRSCECQAPVRLPGSWPSQCCCLIPASRTTAPCLGLAGHHLWDRNYIFFFYKAASLQLKRCCFDTYRKLWKNELQEILSGTVMQILITPIKRKLRHSAKCLL